MAKKRHHHSMHNQTRIDRAHERMGEERYEAMHNQTRIDRAHERMGEERYEAMEGREFYAGHDERRMQEKRDSMMISEDHNAMANMPQQVMMKYWPKEGGTMPEYLDDTIGGIDAQMSGDNAFKKRGFGPHKF